MNTYEAMFIVEPVLASTQWDTVVKHIQDILTKYQAKVIKISKWAIRKLAYEIRKQKRGTYILVYFEAPPQNIARIRADCQLSEIIMRTLILKLNKKEIQKLQNVQTQTNQKGELLNG